MYVNNYQCFLCAEIDLYRFLVTDILTFAEILLKKIWQSRCCTDTFGKDAVLSYNKQYMLYEKKRIRKRNIYCH